MNEQIVPVGTTRHLQKIIDSYAEKGLEIAHEYRPNEGLVYIVIREVRVAFSRHHTESELWDLAVSAFSFVNLLKEVRAIPLHSHVIEENSGGPLFRRLITPEFDSVIRKGDGLYGFEIRGQHYHLDPPPEFIHDHMEFFAKQARAAVERQGMYDQLP